MKIKIYECSFQRLKFLKEFDLKKFPIPQLNSFMMLNGFSYLVKQIIYDYELGIIEITIVEQSLNFSK